MIADLQKLEQKMSIEGYKKTTIKAYLYEFRVLLRFYNASAAERVSTKNIEDYLNHLLKRKYSWSKINLALNAIFFYYNRVAENPRKVKNIKRPKENKKLPNVLSQNEVKLLINNVSNIKHKAILLTIYSAGLRVSELINLKLTDIDSAQNCIWIRGGKGGKDRQTILGESTLQFLRLYFLQYKPKIYLFNGQDGLRYSATSIRKFLKVSTKTSGIKKTVTPHVLRHSFATHLIENGYDITYVQKLLGHTKITTTEQYIHLTTTAVESPADKLFNFAA